ncbi:MAG: RadC family protein [Cellulosilyticaceae bacterium]
MKMEEVPQYMRPYEKVAQLGPQALTDVELLAVLLRSGTQNCNALELARRLLEDHRHEARLAHLYDHQMESLVSVDGIGTVKATQILCLLEMCKRLIQNEDVNKEQFTDPSMVARYFIPEFGARKEEHFVAILLDAKCKLLHYRAISTGSLTASIVHPREVYRYAISKSAYSMIVLHNHPSGDPEPSTEDIQITKRLKDVGQMVGIPLVDHIILGNHSYTSLKEKNYL